MVARRRQVILFQNRRGYSPYQICQVCGWIPQCKYCDVSLTFHKLTNKLHCHYCGTTYPPVAYLCGLRQSSSLCSGILERKRLKNNYRKLSRCQSCQDGYGYRKGKNAHDNLIQQFEQQKDRYTGRYTNGSEGTGF